MLYTPTTPSFVMTKHFPLYCLTNFIAALTDLQLELQEDLDGLVFGHAEGVVDLGGVLGALLGPLPELPRVFARERNDILL